MTFKIKNKSRRRDLRLIFPNTICHSYSIKEFFQYQSWINSVSFSAWKTWPEYQDFNSLIHDANQRGWNIIVSCYAMWPDIALANLGRKINHTNLVSQLWCKRLTCPHVEINICNKGLFNQIVGSCIHFY